MVPPAAIAAAVGRGGGGRVKRVVRILNRCCWWGVVVYTAVSVLVPFVLGMVAIGIWGFSSSAPVSIPAECRILASNVDLRSSKVCGLGLLNVKANHVFYTSGKRDFHCHDDYYWASVFEVEYREYFSGQTIHAVAESPKEALPLDCRPSFRAAWLHRTRLKVNETYSCKYTLGSRKAEIYSDTIFGCQAKDPSMLEMIRRSFILFPRAVSFEMGGSARSVVYAVAGFVLGMLGAMLLTILTKSVQVLLHAMARRWHTRKPRIIDFAARLRRLCLLVAYFSAMGWLTLQYGKLIGLKKLFFDTRFSDTITR